MQKESLESLQAQLAEIDSALAAPAARDAVLDRIAALMRVGGAAQDESRASFLLGQVFEAMLPIRERAALTAARKRVVEQIQALA